MRLITEYETSGLPQKEFVARADVSFSTFQYWLYRKSKKSGLQSGSTQKFLPVELVGSPAPVARAGVDIGPVEVELPAGIRIRFESGNGMSQVLVGHSNHFFDFDEILFSGTTRVILPNDFHHYYQIGYSRQRSPFESPKGAQSLIRREGIANDVALGLGEPEGHELGNGDGAGDEEVPQGLGDQEGWGTAIR